MAKVLQHKVVAALPSTLEADSIYYVRVGTGVDIYVTNGSGMIVGVPTNYLKRVVESRTDVTAETYSIPALRDSSALNLRQTWAPNGNALSVVPLIFAESIGDTSAGNMLGASHQISLFHYHFTKGGGTQATQYGQEFRVKQEDNSRLQEYIATKHVIEPTSSNAGTLGAYILEQFDDMRAAVTHVDRFERHFLDPRMVTFHAGGEIRLPQVITSNYTFKDSDSGKDFYVVSATDVTLTVPLTVTDGFTARAFQVSTGRAVLSFSGMTVAEPESLSATQGVGHQATVGAAPSSNIAFLALTKNTPLLHGGVTPGRLYGAYGRNTLLGITAEAMTANALYPCPIVLNKRTTINTLGIRVPTALSGQNLRLAIYRSNGFGALGARVYQSANISTGTTGDKQVTGLGLVLDPGMYFLCVISSGAAIVNWACNHSLDYVFGRGTSTGMEVVPLYSATLITLPADLTNRAPSIYFDTSSYLPDVYWSSSS